MDAGTAAAPETPGGSEQGGMPPAPGAPAGNGAGADLFAIPWSGSALHKIANDSGARTPGEIGIAMRAATAMAERNPLGVVPPAQPGRSLLVPFALVTLAALAISVFVVTRPPARLDPEALSARLAPGMYRVVHEDGQGSAFVFRSGDGYSIAATNMHVVEEPGKPGCPTGRPVRLDGQHFALVVIVMWCDESNDIALLATTRRLPALRIADSATRRGQEIAALGFPLGGDLAISTGNVSTVSGGVIQHTAATNPGSSGGVLVDASGTVVGVTTAKIVDEAVEGVSFAVPSAAVCTLLRKALAEEANAPLRMIEAC